MKSKLLIAALILGAYALGQTRAKYFIKATHLGITTMGISCLNGADPTGTKFGNVVIMSCGPEPKEKRE